VHHVFFFSTFLQLFPQTAQLAAQLIYNNITDSKAAVFLDQITLKQAGRRLHGLRA